VAFSISRIFSTNFLAFTGKGRLSTRSGLLDPIRKAIDLPEKAQTAQKKVWKKWIQRLE